MQATEEYLAVSKSEQTLRAMPVKPPGLPTQPSALKVSLKAMADAVTQQTMLPQQVLEKILLDNSRVASSVMAPTCNEIAPKVASSSREQPNKQ